MSFLGYFVQLNQVLAILSKCSICISLCVYSFLYAVNKFLFYFFHCFANMFAESYFVFISQTVEVCLLIENFDYCFRIFDSIPFTLSSSGILICCNDRSSFCRLRRRRHLKGGKFNICRKSNSTAALTTVRKLKTNLNFNRKSTKLLWVEYLFVFVFVSPIYVQFSQ